MPPATQYVDVSSPDKTGKILLDIADQERKAREAAHSLAWAYYDGRHSLPLKVGEDGVDNNVVVNLVQKGIDRTIGFLFPDLPTIDLQPTSSDGAQPRDEATRSVSQPAQGVVGSFITGGPPGGSPENLKSQKTSKTGSDLPNQDRSPEEKYLDEALEENDGLLVFLDIALNGCIGGTNYVRILEEDEDNDYPRLLPIDGSQMITFWDSADRSKVLWHSQRFYVGAVLHQLDFINEGASPDGAGWTIVEYAKQGSKWVKLGIKPWGYPLSPVVSWKHLPQPRSYYGKSETWNASLNDSANKVASDVKAILRTHASPRTIGIGMAADEVIKTAIDNFWAIENEQASVKNLEMQSDLVSSMNFLHFLTEEFMEENRVTVLKGGPEAFKNVTNLGIRTAFLDTTAKIKVLQKNYERGLKEIVKRLLMLGKKNWETVKINVQWANPLPLSDMETAQVIQMERDMSLISKKTSRLELGLDNAQEEARIQAEGDPALEAMAKFMQGPGGMTEPGTPQNKGMMNGQPKRAESANPKGSKPFS